MSLAAYNAGPGGLRRARTRARQLGLDPNVWFDNVEIRMAHSISREPVVYVRNIFKYYTAYRLVSEQRGLLAESPKFPRAKPQLGVPKNPAHD